MKATAPETFTAHYTRTGHDRAVDEDGRRSCATCRTPLAPGAPRLQGHRWNRAVPEPITNAAKAALP